MAHCDPPSVAPLLLHHTQHTTSCLPASRTWLCLRCHSSWADAQALPNPLPTSLGLAAVYLPGGSPQPLSYPTPSYPIETPPLGSQHSAWHTVGSPEMVSDYYEWFPRDANGFWPMGLCEGRASPSLRGGRGYCEGGGLGAECQLDLEKACFPAPFPEPWILSGRESHGNIEPVRLWRQKTHIRCSLGPTRMPFCPCLRSQRSRVRAPPRPSGTESQLRGPWRGMVPQGQVLSGGLRSQVKVRGESLEREPVHPHIL